MIVVKFQSKLKLWGNNRRASSDTFTANRTTDNDSHLGNRVAGKAEMFNAFYASVLDTDGPGRSGLS